MILTVSELSVTERQNWLQHAIAPRPIGLISTVNMDGEPNLAAFSFFNLVSSNPPLVIFSPARRVRDNTIKHTLRNLYDVREAVIHIVTQELVQQTSLASCEYPEGVDEFLKAGFTKEPATVVKPPMVKESPVKLECKITQIQPLGKEGGAGNLIIAEVLCMHINESILNDQRSMIDKTKLQHVARLGADWYCKVEEKNLFKVPKPNKKFGIGIDALPDFIRSSRVLTGNDLAMLAHVDLMPLKDELFFTEMSISKNQQHLFAKELLKKGNIEEAWQVLLSCGE